MIKTIPTPIGRLWPLVAAFWWLFSCHSPQPKTRVVKIGLTHSQHHSFTRALARFRDEVARQTNGRYQVKIFHSAQLGGERAMQEMLVVGTLDISLTGLLNAYEPLFSVFELPYLYKNRTHVLKVHESGLIDRVAATLHDHRIALVGFYENGFRHITNSVRPIEHPKDLEGLLIRTPENPAQMETIKALGAIPTPMSFSELYTALLQGVVDGQENPLQNIWCGRLYEAQPHVAKTAHIYNSVYVIAGTRFWNTLPPKDREIFSDALRASSRWQLSLMQRLDDQLEDKMKAEGVQFTTPDLEAFEKASAGAYENMYLRHGDKAREIVNTIKNMPL